VVLFYEENILMITQNEIEQKAEQLGVDIANVQRDYVFGWLLSGLYQAENPLHRLLILKGGNCFRKAYFEYARFSNDLDFSTQTDLDENLLGNSIRQACLFAKERSEVEFLPDENKIKLRGLIEDDAKLYEARVYFKSFYGEGDIRIKVKLDIKEYDRIFLPIQKRRLIHAYSDANACQADLQCIKLEELLASKLNALLQRRHSPDLYDFVHAVFFQKALDIRRLEVISTFLKKTIYEPDPRVAKNLLLELPFQLIREFWNEYLICPKLSIISFDDAENWFRNAITELFALIEPQYQIAGGYRGASLSFFSSSFRDIIMEAGRLRRILRLVYDGVQRWVEPYSLSYKRRRDGVAREYFYAWDLSGGHSGHVGIKSFISEKVQSVQISEETFEPRFPIELSKAGGYFGKRDFSASSFRSTAPKKTFDRQRSGLTYTIECPYCGKKFKRTKLDTKLNEHKDRYGNRCYGRFGSLV